MPKKEKVKRARAKPKNVIQKVVVNVGGRGGGASKSTAPSGPPRPTPLQQATQFVQSFQQPRQGESMIQSAQMLQRLLDPINARLDVLMQSSASLGRQPGSINITNPPINIRQPDIFMAPPNVSINQRFPDINIQAPNFPNMGEHRDHNRQHVADLPDEPLVRPNAPLVLAGPMRMDDPHEDVPLNQVDSALLGKQEAQSSASLGKRKPIIGDESSESEAEVEPAQASALGINFPYDFFTLEDVNKLVVRRKAGNLSDVPSLEEVVQHFGIRIPNKMRNKESMIQLLRQKVSNFHYE